MKYKLTLLLITLFLSLTLPAQKHDYIWVGGEQNDLPDTTRGGFVVDFNTFPPTTFRQHRELDMFVSSTVISDTAGQIQAYTDGCDVVNGLTGEIFPNGHDINPGWVNSFQCHSSSGVGAYTGGFQSSLFLPLPDTTGIYYLFHKRVQVVWEPFDAFTDRLFYSVVDMHINGGEGDVVVKNIPVMADTLTAGHMTAVKHANGRDWWILSGRRRKDEVYCFLFTHNGIQDTVFQTIGNGFIPVSEGSAQIVFSADGTQLATCNPQTGIHLLDFDRSTGLLSNYRQYPVEFLSIVPDVMGCAFSPNGRFLYVTTVKEIFQYDLQSEDVPGSRVLLDVWEEFYDPLPTTFLLCQLGPDCKIYVQTGQQARWMHVIHNPNLLGLDCSFQQRGFQLATPNRGSVSFFPNYRLGPIESPGEPCTVVLNSYDMPDVSAQSFFSVFPNPVRDVLTIVPNKIQVTKDLLFTIISVNNQIVREFELEKEASTYRLPIGHLPAGIYAYTIKESGGRLVQSGRLVSAF